MTRSNAARGRSQSLSIILLIVVATLARPSILLSSEHDRLHEYYRHWKTTDGNSCCSNRDCKPVELRVTNAGVQIFAEERWVDVPKEKIRPYISPDGRGHACIIPPFNLQSGSPLPLEKRILCVVGPWGA